MALSGRHLLGLQGVPKEDIQLILDTATTFREVLERPIKKVPTLQGKTVVNLFMRIPHVQGFLSSLPRKDFPLIP